MIFLNLQGSELDSGTQQYEDYWNFTLCTVSLYQGHLGAHWRCRTSGFLPDLLNQNLYLITIPGWFLHIQAWEKHFTRVWGLPAPPQVNMHIPLAEFLSVGCEESKDVERLNNGKLKRWMLSLPFHRGNCCQWKGVADRENISECKKIKNPGIGIWGVFWWTWGRLEDIGERGALWLRCQGISNTNNEPGSCCLTGGEGAIARRAEGSYLCIGLDLLF